MPNSVLWERIATEEQARAPRRTLQLEVHGTSALGTARVLVRNISTTGLLIESTLDLPAGEILSFDLPHAGPTRAKIVWASGDLFGCQFHTPITPAVLAAAQLQGLSPLTEPSEPATRTVTHGESFGSRLQRLRKERRFTLSQVAAALGVSKPTVWAWENGKARPVESRLDSLAEALGVPKGELLGGRDPASLDDILASSRERIALALGASPDKIRILIEI